MTWAWFNLLIPAAGNSSFTILSPLSHVRTYLWFDQSATHLSPGFVLLEGDIMLSIDDYRSLQQDPDVRELLRHEVDFTHITQDALVRVYK